MNRSSRGALAVLTVLACFSVAGCFLGYDGPSYAYYRIELGENPVDEPSSELTWILTIILEAHHYDCELSAENKLRRIGSYSWIRCFSPGNNHTVSYRFDQSGVELHVLAQPRDIVARVEELLASFDAANLRYFAIH